MQRHKHLNSTGAKIGRPSKSTVVKTRQRCLPMNYFNPKTMVTRRLPKVEPLPKTSLAGHEKFRHVFLRNSIWTDSIPSPSADPRGVDKSFFFPMFLGSKSTRLFWSAGDSDPESSTFWELGERHDSVSKGKDDRLPNMFFSGAKSLRERNVDVFSSRCFWFSKNRWDRWNNVSPPIGRKNANKNTT